MQEGETKVKCPSCKDVILKSCGDQVRMRAALLKWTPDGFYAICKSCKKDVKMDFEILKSIQTKFEFVAKKSI